MKNPAARFLAILALVLPFGAYAGGTSTFSASGGAFGDGSATGGPFSDSFSFNVNATDSAVVVITAPLNGGFTITNAGFQLITGGTVVSGLPAVQFLTFPGFPNFKELVFTDTFGALKPGAYFMDIGGNFGPSGGSYAGTLGLIAAVPEPSTWAAMLVGVGMMIFVARRRVMRDLSESPIA